MTGRASSPDTLTRPPMTERALMEAVVEMAQWLGFLVYHPWLSVKSAGGFPDLTLCHPTQRRVLFVELKAERGLVSPHQKAWIAALALAGAEVYCWRPAHWLDGTIERVLTGPPVMVG